MAKSKPADTGVKIVDSGSHVVTDQEVLDAQTAGRGFKIIENETTIIAAPKAEYDQALAEKKVSKEQLRNQPLKTEGGEKPAPKRERSGELLRRTAPEPEPEAEVEIAEAEEVIAEAEETAETEAEEVLELNEVDFLKHHDLYNNNLRSMKDVDKEIQLWQRRLDKLEGYDGNEHLLLVDVDSDPEIKVEALKSLRKVTTRLYNESKARPTGGTRPTEEPPKRAVDYLSEEEKAQLATGENIGDIIEKIVDIKVAEKTQPVMRQVQQSEYRSALAELGVTQEKFDADVKGIIAERPYLRKVLSIDGLSLNDKLDLLQQFRKDKYSAADIDAAKAAGRKEQAETDARRRAHVTLKPTRAARTVTTQNQQAEQEAQAKILEARKARKEGGRTHVSNIVSGLIQRGSNRG